MVDWLFLSKYFLNTISTFFCASAVLVFLHCFYDPAFQWNRKKALVLLVASLLESLFLDTGNMLVSALFILLVTTAAIFDYRGKFFSSLKFLAVYAVVALCSATISTNAACIIFPEQAEAIFNTYAEAYNGIINLALDSIPDVVVFFTLGLNILFYGFIFLYIYYKMYKRGILLKCGERELIFASVYPVLCFGFEAVIIQYGAESSQINVLLTIMSVLFALTFPVFIYYIRISKSYQERNALQQNYIQTQLSQFNQYKLSQEETARFRHDIRNNLLCVNDLLQSGKLEEAKEYLHDLLKVSENLRLKYVTGDDMLNCIVGAKSRTFALNRIQFQLDGVLAGGLKWKPIDICTVFANALDNAIEACMQLPEQDRYINMFIRSTAQYWFVTIENPTGKDIDTQQLFQKNGGFSSKEGPQHGIGTYNMRRTVESYKGQLKAHCENNRFTLEIMIDKSIA